MGPAQVLYERCKLLMERENNEIITDIKKKHGTYGIILWTNNLFYTLKYDKHFTHFVD